MKTLINGIPMPAIGGRIKFKAFRSPWSITATNRRFTICAKKLSGCCAEHKYCYTIIDWENKVRAPDNMTFGPFSDYSDPVEAKEALGKLDNQYRRRRFKVKGPHYNKLVLTEPELQLSRRRNVPLDIEFIDGRPHN